MSCSGLGRGGRIRGMVGIESDSVEEKIEGSLCAGWGDRTRLVKWMRGKRGAVRGEKAIDGEVNTCNEINLYPVSFILP